MNSRFLGAILVAAWSPAAIAQLQLTQVSGGVERPVGAVFSFGSIDTGDSAGASFRIRNTGTAAVALTPITVLGTAFLLVAAPQPASLNPQATFDFAISFQPGAAGTYSATLQASGTTVLLTGAALAGFSWQTITPSGVQPLASPVEFGAVVLGSRSIVRFTVVNQTAQAMVVPGVSVSGADFMLEGESPGGTLLAPLASAAFAIAFVPTTAGQHSGSLAAGTHSFALAGTGQAPPLPKASMNIDLGNPHSAQQGGISVAFDSASPIAASGTVSMSFSPAAGMTPSAASDPAIAFASGGLTAPFTVAAGASRAYFGVQPAAAFATGTTAGTLTFTLAFVGTTSQQTVTIAPAAVGLTGVQAIRQSGSVAVQVAGFDNTRSAGKLNFTFYDVTGSVIAPGTITADAGSDFANYFRTSNLGGAFSLTAVFPVTGNISQVASFDVEMSNSAGTARSPRTVF